MPLIVKDYTWSETELQIFICIPLKGIKASKVDIFSTENYIKVSINVLSLILICNVMFAFANILNAFAIVSYLIL
jgi:hypothetical protein